MKRRPPKPPTPLDRASSYSYNRYKDLDTGIIDAWLAGYRAGKREARRKKAKK